MASEPGLNNTNVSNCSSFWQLNPDCFNYNQNVFQIKSTNQYNNSTYQPFSSTSNFYQPHISSYINNNKSPLYSQVFNSEFHEFAGNDHESFKFYPNGNYCTLPGKSTELANNSVKTFFNPMYSTNFFEAKNYQPNYSNINVISSESYLNAPSTEQKWSLNQNLDPSLTSLNLEQQDEKCPEDDSESSQDSSNLSVKNQPISNSKTDMAQVKTQSLNQKKTRTKDKYRVVYSELQRSELEKEFNFSKYITSRKKTELALELGLSQRQIKIWFQNRRAKDRKMNKKKKIDQNPNGHAVNSSMNFHNNEVVENGMNNFESKQFSWQNDPSQVRTFAEVNVQLNRQNQQISSEFLGYNQNGLNYGI